MFVGGRSEGGMGKGDGSGEMMENSLEECKQLIDKMLKRSQTKVIFPIITYGLINRYMEDNKSDFSDLEIRKEYIKAVDYFKIFLNHNLHFGAKYYDAYSSRNLPKYKVIKSVGLKKYELLEIYKKNAKEILEYIPDAIQKYIEIKLGIIPLLADVKKDWNLLPARTISRHSLISIL